MAQKVYSLVVPETLGEAFAFVCSVLGAYGFNLSNPHSGKISSWNDEGDQLFLHETAYLEQIVNGEFSNVQFWSKDGYDIFVSWELERAAVVFSLKMGLNPLAQELELISGLLSAYISRYRKCIVDRDFFSLAWW